MDILPIHPCNDLMQQKTNIEITSALACEFQQCGILTSVYSNEPMQSPFKLRN